MGIAPGIVSVSVTTVSGTYKDLDDFGFVVDPMRGIFDGAKVSYATEQRPGRLETVLTSLTATGQPRDLVIEGHVIADTLAALTTNIRNLTGWCRRAVAVKTAHDSATFLNVKQVDVQITHPPMQGVALTCGVSITFRAFDPLWYATSASAVTFSSNTAMPLGTAPSRPVLRLTGTHTNPTITYKNSGGTTITTLVLTITIAGATDYVEIDCASLTIVKSVSSVITDAIDTLTSGDFIVLDPADADTVTPTWGSLSVSLGSGSVTAVSTFRPAYY